MSGHLLVAIILFIIVLGAIFAYRVNAAYQGLGSLVAAICALVLFLMAINVIHF